MANLRTSSDILYDALFRADEEQSSNSDYYDQALVYLNRIYQGICSGASELDVSVDESWWWLRKATPGVLVLQPSFNTAKVSVAQNSNSIIYSSVPINNTGQQISVQGCFLMVTGDNGDVYRITSHIAGQASATIDCPYTYTTQVNAAQRTIQYQYQLASDMRSIVGRMRAYQQNRYDIDYSDVDPMRTQFPIATGPTGVPVLFAMVQEQTCEFSHYPGDDPTDVMRVEYDYLIVPPDLVDDGGLTAPLMPFQYRQILSDGTAYLILTDKDDNRNAMFLSSAKQKLKAMQEEHRRRAAKTSNLTGKIMPRQRDVRWYDSPMRTQSGLIIG